MQNSTRGIGQENRLASDAQRQQGQQAWEKSLRRRNRHFCVRGNASPQANKNQEEARLGRSLPNL